MIKNYFNTFVRLIKSNKLVSLLNFLGLIMGITACILIFYYVLYEKSYDKFHKDKDQIYRIITENYKNNLLTRESTCTPVPMANAAKNEISEIESFTRFAFCGNAELNYEENNIFEEDVFFVEPSFFDFFSFPIKEGANYDVLNEPNTMFLSESFAKKIFGEENPIGKIISIVSFNKKHYCTIKGIFYDLPENTYFKINAVVSFRNFYYTWGDHMDENWIFHLIHTYIKINPNADPKTVEEKLKILAEKYMGDFFKTSNVYRKYKLQPIDNMYLYSDMLYEFGKNGDGKSVTYLSIIAILILLISLVNLLNLQSSQAIKRAKEIGVRKILGGNKTNLSKQLYIESIFLSLIVIIITVFLFLQCRYPVQQLIEKQIAIMHSVWIIVIAIFALTFIIPGTFLFVLLSSIKSVDVLKGKNKVKSTHTLILLKKSFLLFQFIASFTFITLSLTINKQLKYIYNQDLGIDIDNTLIIKKPFIPQDDIAYFNNYKSFCQEIKKYPDVKNISQSKHIPGEDIISRQRFRKKGEDVAKEEYCSVMTVDYDYLSNYQHKFLAIKETPKTYYENNNKIILNEDGAKLLGFNDYANAIGQIILRGEAEFEIIGIIKNYHQQSLKLNYLPTVMILNEDPTGGYLSLKLNNNKNNATLIESIRKMWKEHFPENPIQYFFLKDFFQKQYSSELLLNKVILILTIISLIITFMGVSGISFSEIVNRTKEIGVRKILGASISRLILTFAKDFLMLIIIAISIGFYISYKLINNWLNDFAFRIKMPWELLIITSIILCALVIMTISIYVIFVSSANPEKAIRKDM